jgi:hypothetical protein
VLGSKGFGAKDFGSEQCLVFVKFLGLKVFGVKRFGVKICCWHPMFGSVTHPWSPNLSRPNHQATRSWLKSLAV